VRKRLFIAGTALLILIGLGIWEANHTKEPQYKGKPLSFWLDNNRTPAEAKEAVDHLGTNCIPTLLRMLQAEDSKTKQKFAKWAYQQNFITINVRVADDAHRNAIRGFEILGAHAQGAVGDLIGLYEKSPPVQQCFISEALAYIGPTAKEAIPALLHTMTGTNDTVREFAAAALGQIGQERDLVIPAMAKMLWDPNPSRRTAAVICFEYYGTNAAPAVPALIAAARDPVSSVRSEVMYALMRTHGEPQLVVPVLTNALSDSNAMVQERAAWALGSYGTNSISAIPKLMALATEADYIVRNGAIASLAKIHSQPDLTVPLLTKALENRNKRMRAVAAEGLGNFGKEATSAVPALIELYHREQNQLPEHDPFKPQAIKTIREALLKIDPTAAAQTGINTNPPALPSKRTNTISLTPRL
jgi:HEAT repeat protein